MKVSYDNQISRRSIPYRVIAIFVVAVLLIVHLNAVIIKEYTRGIPKGYAMLFYILSVFLLVILKFNATKVKSDKAFRESHIYRYPLFPHLL